MSKKLTTSEFEARLKQLYLAQILDAELQVNTEITSQIQKVVEHCNA